MSVDQPILYLVRHGETTWNRVGRLQGHLDSELTPAGVEQARAIGEIFRREIFHINEVCIETSPSGRAHRTATIIADALGISGDTLIITPLLAEHDFGDWSGLIPSEIDSKYPGARVERQARKWDYIVPRGESYALVAARAQEWLSMKRSATTTIAVTHEIISRTIQGAYAGLTVEETLARSHRHDRIYRLQGGLIDGQDVLKKRP
jgi:broad specificity phosphatase PhoE